jgi:hypothetical protein
MNTKQVHAKQGLFGGGTRAVHCTVAHFALCFFAFPDK